MAEQDLLAPTVLAAVARNKRLTSLVVLSFALLGILYAFSQKPTATATASFVVAPPVDAAADPNFVNDQVSILQFPSTADAAAKLLKQTVPTSRLTGDDVLASEHVLAGTTSNLVTVRFGNADPVLAQAGANSLVTAYTNALAATASANLKARTAQYATTIAGLTRQIIAAGGPTTVQGAPLAASLATQEASLGQLESTGGSSASVATSSTARLPKTSRSLAPLAGLVLGGIVGLLPAVGAAYLLAQTRRKFSDRFQPEILLQRQLLSDIPDFTFEGLRSDVPAADAPHSSSAEAFRFVSTALDQRATGTGPLVVAVSGGSSLDGKTAVAANLAVTFARRGLRTIAVDADLDGHGLGFLLLGDKRHAPGLAEVLAGRATAESVVQPVLDDVDPNLRVLPAGLLHGPTVTDLVSRSNVRQVLSALGQQTDVLVLDVPSPLQVAYASSMLAAVGHCLVVVPHGSSPARLAEFTARVVSLGVDAIGYVYTKAPLRRQLGQLSRYVTDRQRVATAERFRPAAPSRGEAPDWERRSADVANELHAGRSVARVADVHPFVIGDTEPGFSTPTRTSIGESGANELAAAELGVPKRVGDHEHQPLSDSDRWIDAQRAEMLDDESARTPVDTAKAEHHDQLLDDASTSAERASGLPALSAQRTRTRRRTRNGSWVSSDRP